MDTAISDKPRIFIQFSELVAKTTKQHIGRNLKGNALGYVPFRELQSFWTFEHIEQVLGAFPTRLDALPTVIRSKYLRIFSTLVYSGADAVSHLPELFIGRDLSDAKFPQATRPGEWPETPLHVGLFERIEEQQWRFFPLDFCPDQLQNRLLDDRYILPMDEPEDIVPSGEAASVQLVVIHDGHCQLAGRKLDGNPLPLEKRTFVFKKYHNKLYESYYNNELSALRLLASAGSPNVVRLHGSFRQHDAMCLVLEYVNGGNLGDFYTREAPPSTIAEVKQFWQSLFGALAGLNAIHQRMQAGDENDIGRMKGIHQDIRPENILLMKGASGSPYDFTVKIADFGLYSSVRTSRSLSSESLGRDNHGNKLYSSPEACSHTRQRQRGTNSITPRSDIFSLGAVLSHAAAWVAQGCELQKRHILARREYHRQHVPRFQDTGYEGCYHDSINTLPIVKDCHDQIRSQLQPLDRITKFVLDIAEEYMLLRDADGRWPARDILEKFEQHLIAPCTASLASIPNLLTPVTPGFPLSTTSTVDQPSLWSAGPVSPPSLDGISYSESTEPKATPTPAPVPKRPGMPASMPLITVSQPNLEPLAVTSPAKPAAMRSSPNNGEPGNTNGPPSLSNDSSSVSLATTHSTAPSATSSTAASPSHTTTAGASGAADGGGSQSQSPPSTHDASSNFTIDDLQDYPWSPEVQHLVELLQVDLHGRDQFFFIDDSSSMEAHRATITRAFDALSRLAKRLDPDRRVELAFASHPTKVYRSRRTTKLRRLVARHEYRARPGMMGDRFGGLVDELIKWLPVRILGFNLHLMARRKVSVYIFTDGNWGPDTRRDACGVRAPIERLMNVLKSRGLDRSQVSLHFLRFGENEEGRQHLTLLDEFGRTEGWDIVDVKHITTDVSTMMYGPIDPANDDLPERPVQAQAQPCGAC